jgi:archaemetzincin
MIKIGVLRIGQVDTNIVNRIEENLHTAFSDAKSASIPEPIPIPVDAFDKTRGQCRSDIVLLAVHNYAENSKALDRVLGVVDVDVFLPRLNFVFGEAENPGKAALISLWRLRPEFYGRPSNIEVFVERSSKEAIHELGHTFGLDHCHNPFCVMFFSNSIFETDRKKSLFCSSCYSRIEENAHEAG